MTKLQIKLLVAFVYIMIISMILNENVDYVMLIHFVVAHRKLTLFTIDSKYLTMRHISSVAFLDLINAFTARNR